MILDVILGMTSDVVSDMTWLYNEFLAVAYVTAKSRYENVQSIK